MIGLTSEHHRLGQGCVGVYLQIRLPGPLLTNTCTNGCCCRNHAAGSDQLRVPSGFLPELFANWGQGGFSSRTRQQLAPSWSGLNSNRKLSPHLTCLDRPLAGVPGRQRGGDREFDCRRMGAVFCYYHLVRPIVVRTSGGQPVPRPLEDSQYLDLWRTASTGCRISVKRWKYGALQSPSAPFCLRQRYGLYSDCAILWSGIVQRTLINSILAMSSTGGVGAA